MGDIDLGDIRKTCLNSLYSCTENIKYLGSTKDVNLNKLRHCVMEYSKLDFEHNARQHALTCVQQETDSNLIDSRYREELDKQKKVRQDFENHPYMVDLKKKISAVESRVAEEDMDLAITGTINENIDPMSLRPIINPIRNTICNHVYEMETIEDFLKKSKSQKCPYAGCRSTNKINIQDLVPNEELMRRLTQAESAGDSE